VLESPQAAPETAMQRIAIACLLAVLALGAHAQSPSKGVYKWKDARGVTQYSDTPPANVRYTEVHADASPRAAAASAAIDPRCVTARANIEHLRSGRTDLSLDSNRDGTPDTPLTDAQRAEQMRMAEASARAFCPQA
jgi:hypothetical protein